MRVSGERVGNAVGVERSGEPFRTRDPGAVSHPAMITPHPHLCNPHTVGVGRPPWCVIFNSTSMHEYFFRLQCNSACYDVTQKGAAIQ